MTELQNSDEEIWLDAACAHGLAEHLFLHLPYEACGVLRGVAAAGGMRIQEFIPIRNVAPDPLHHFFLHPDEWVRQCLSGSDLVGLFHTHPRSAPIPSSEDLQQLAHFGGMLSVYLIGSPVGLGPSIHINAYMIHTSPEGIYDLRQVHLRMA